MKYVKQHFVTGMKVSLSDVLNRMEDGIAAACGAAVEGIGSVLEESGYQLLLINTANDPQKELRALDTLCRHTVDGILLIATVYTPEHKAVPERMHVPLVVLGQQFPGCCSVYHDDFGAAQAATAHMLAKGRHAPGYIGVTLLDKAAGHGNPFAQYRLGKLCLTGESVKKDVRKALEYLTAAARQGNPFAQYTLGKLYLLGRDVEQDREQARDWFTRSAAQGNAYAQFFLDRFDQFRDPSVMLAATKLLHHMSRIFRDNSMPPRNPAGIRIDSKRRKRLTEKRMAMGHKADDHEEQVSYQQTM